MLAVEEWLLNETGSSRATAVSQLYLQRYAKDAVVLLICKLSDDFLITGEEMYCKKIFYQLKLRFKIDRISTGHRHSFGGCEIVVGEDGITISMEEYWK